MSDTQQSQTSLDKLTIRLGELGRGLDDKEIRERLEEYIEVKKLEKRLLQEIMKLINKQDETAKYVNDLSTDLADLQVELDAEEAAKVQKVVDLLGKK